MLVDSAHFKELKIFESGLCGLSTVPVRTKKYVIWATKYELCNFGYSGYELNVLLHLKFSLYTTNINNKSYAKI